MEFTGVFSFHISNMFGNNKPTLTFKKTFDPNFLPLTLKEGHSATEMEVDFSFFNQLFSSFPINFN